MGSKKFYVYVKDVDKVKSIFAGYDGTINQKRRSC